MQAKEAAEKLGRTEEELKVLVRDGKLREFRDAGSVNYKISDVDPLAKVLASSRKPPVPQAAEGARPAEPCKGTGASISEQLSTLDDDPGLGAELLEEIDDSADGSDPHAELDDGDGT